jgi:hypothetical protein
MIMVLLALAAMVSMMPAQAEEGNEAALKRQLDEVQQQLHELQFKVLDIESRIGAAQAPSPAAVPASIPSPTPPPVIVAPSTITQPAPAPVRVESGTSRSSAVVPAAFQWREMLKDQWHSVMAGMSAEEIGKLLGTPSRKLTLDGKPVWYYSYPGIGNGSVMFSRDGHTVAGWQHPPFGFW